MSIKNVSKKTQTVEISKVNAPAWVTKAKTDSHNAIIDMMENGRFFNGMPGSGNKVRAIIIQNEPTEAMTKTNLPVLQIQVMRLSSHVEQTMGILTSITAVVDQLAAIAMSNDGNLKEVVIDVEFTPGKGSLNYIKTITKVATPKMEMI